MAKHKVHGEAMRARAYPVLCEAVEAGVAYGWNRAHKHEDAPSEETIRAAIRSEVLNAICEAFDFEGDTDGD